VGYDALVLTTFGAKAHKSKTGVKSLSVADERRRCDAALSASGLQLKWAPTEIRKSISNASFV
jgi:hypothetical protein